MAARRLDHGLGVQSLYGHLSSIGVKVATKSKRSGDDEAADRAGRGITCISPRCWREQVTPVDWWRHSGFRTRAAQIARSAAAYPGASGIIKGLDRLYAIHSSTCSVTARPVLRSETGSLQRRSAAACGSRTEAPPPAVVTNPVDPAARGDYGRREFEGNAPARSRSRWIPIPTVRNSRATRSKGRRRRRIRLAERIRERRPRRPGVSIAFDPCRSTKGCRYAPHVLGVRSARRGRSTAATTRFTTYAVRSRIASSTWRTSWRESNTRTFSQRGHDYLQMRRS